jgi:predicted regulator of Ras-like GTPase activity (Roadblock/LC7/MglB family)
MRDEIARLSEIVAREPAGMGWLALADALRRARQLEAAQRVAQRGLSRHPYAADGHDVLARIAADGGDPGRARDEWEMAVRLDPRHVGALLGLSWLALTHGDAGSARRWWASARDAAPGDPRVAAAARTLQASRAPAPSARPAPAAPARAGFGPVPEGARLALLVDADGLVLAGGVAENDPSAAGSGPALEPSCVDALAAELSGLMGEARVALAELQLGAWERLHVECETMQLAMSPVAEDGVALVATSADAPAGLSRLLLERTRRRAQSWMEGL